MLYTWQWAPSRPHSEGLTHWVWDSSTAIITGFIHDREYGRFKCSCALDWFKDRRDSWTLVMDPDLEMDEGL